MNIEKQISILIDPVFLRMKRLRWYQMVKMPEIPAPVEPTKPKEKRKWIRNELPPGKNWQDAKTVFPRRAEIPKNHSSIRNRRTSSAGSILRSHLRLGQPDDRSSQQGSRSDPEDLLRRRGAHTLPKPASKLTVYLDGTVTDSSIVGGKGDGGKGWDDY